MNDNNHKCRENRDAVKIGIWENEGGSPDRDNMDHHYGRRVEANRSWTVYHVFTGAPANIGGQTMAGLGRAAATDRMLSMNLRNASRRKERIRMDAPRLDAGEIDVLGWR